MDPPNAVEGGTVRMDPATVYIIWARKDDYAYPSDAAGLTRPALTRRARVAVLALAGGSAATEGGSGDGAASPRVGGAAWLSQGASPGAKPKKCVLLRGAARASRCATTVAEKVEGHVPRKAAARAHSSSS